VPSEKQQSKPASKKSASKKAIAEAVVEVFEETGGLMGLFDDTPAAEEEKKPEASATFTAEQDKTLMDMKNSGNAWTEIAKKLGKDTDDCKERFKLIKLAGWMPTDKGGNQKKQQNKGDNKDKIQRKQSQKAEKKDEKKDENNNADANGNTHIPLTFPQSLTFLQAMPTMEAPTITRIQVTTPTITRMLSTYQACGEIPEISPATPKKALAPVKALKDGVTMAELPRETEKIPGATGTRPGAKTVLEAMRRQRQTVLGATHGQR
jgi:hypothetical protein